MSTLQEHLDSDVDLESNVVAGGGAGEVAAVGSGGGAEAKGAVENNGSKKDRDERRDSNFSVCSVDLELGVIENKLQFAASVKDCRICHLSMDSTNQDSGTPIELGCSCKDDLAAAHKQCAETWFKIKGNKTCEICGSIAQNVAGINEGELMEDWNDGNDTRAPQLPVSEFLAWSSIIELFVSLYGVCIRHILAFSLQRALVT